MGSAPSRQARSRSRSRTERRRTTARARASDHPCDDPRFAYRVLARQFAQKPEDNVFVGKLPIYMFSTPAEFRAQFSEAGLRVEHSGGYWLKPLSNGQTDEWFTPEMNDAFMALGERYPEIAAETFVIASRA